MDLRRLRAGEWITAVSGVVLIISLFLPWYRIEVPAHALVPGVEVGGALEFTAWEAFSVVDVLLLVVGLLAVGLLVLTALQPTAAVGIASDALLTLVAGGVAIVAVIRVLDIPGGLEIPERLHVETVRAGSAWVGLAAVLGVVVGTIIAMRDERLSGPAERTDATGVPVRAERQIEAFPAPPREG